MKKILIDNIENVEKIMKVDSDFKQGVIDFIYTVYSNDVSEPQRKALKQMKEDYLDEKDDWEDFYEFKDNEGLSYDYVLSDRVILDLAKNELNLSSMLEAIDEVDEVIGLPETSETLIDTIKEEYLKAIGVINNNEVKDILYSLFIDEYIEYIQNGSDESFKKYEKKYNDSIDIISDLLEK